MKHLKPNKLGGAAIKQVMEPVRNALLQFRLGSAEAEAYHALAVAVEIAHGAASIVQRHRHLIPELKPSVNAINAVWDRADGADKYTATPEECDALDAAAEIYKAMMLTVSGKHMRKVIAELQKRPAGTQC